jgi:hypothetical protein
MLVAAEMYVKGVSTRAVEKVLAEFGVEGLSSTQVLRLVDRLKVHNWLGHLYMLVAGRPDPSSRCQSAHAARAFIKTELRFRPSPAPTKSKLVAENMRARLR